MISWRLVGPLFPLLGLSLLILGGISWQLALNQLLFIFIGGLGFYFIANYPFFQHRLLTRVYWLAMVILLLLPFVIGVVTRGAIRWIPLGSFSLQPSEFIKPLLILVLAGYLSRIKNRFTYRQFFIYWLLAAVPFILIFKQPDLGTALVVAAISLGMLFFSRVNRQQLIVLLLLIIVGLPLGFKLLQPYQRERLSGFLNPYADPAGSGYQVIQSMIAAGSGGWLGQGLGAGSQSQLKFLPEQQSDFIFSNLVEELGLAGGAIIILAYWWLLIGLARIGDDCPDEFGRLVIAGVTVMIWFQVAVAIGMNLGLMPVTGINLPLVSSGGSSLLGTMVSLGLVNSVWKFSRYSL